LLITAVTIRKNAVVKSWKETSFITLGVELGGRVVTIYLVIWEVRDRNWNNVEICQDSLAKGLFRFLCSVWFGT
jgi:hypothetical protein